MLRCQERRSIHGYASTWSSRLGRHGVANCQPTMRGSVTVIGRGTYRRVRRPRRARRRSKNVTCPHICIHILTLDVDTYVGAGQSALRCNASSTYDPPYRVPNPNSGNGNIPGGQVSVPQTSFEGSRHLSQGSTIPAMPPRIVPLVLFLAVPLSVYIAASGHLLEYHVRETPHFR